MGDGGPLNLRGCQVEVRTDVNPDSAVLIISFYSFICQTWPEIIIRKIKATTKNFRLFFKALSTFQPLDSGILTSRVTAIGLNLAIASNIAR